MSPVCHWPRCVCTSDKACSEFSKHNYVTPQQPIKQIKQITPMTPANAKQVAGDHYKQYGNLQPWDVIIAWKMDYLTGTALKYLARWKDKGGIDDLKKAIHFIEKQIEVAEAEAAAKTSIKVDISHPNDR